MSNINKYIIVDRPGLWMEQLRNFTNLVPVCFDPLCSRLRQQLLLLDQASYLILLPGNSARDTWERIGLSGFEVVDVYAKRVWQPGSKAVVTVETLPVPKHLSTKIPVLVDDVVSTGITVSLVKQRNEHLFPVAHNKPWKLLSPISRRKKISGYDLSYEYLVDNESGRKPPINSLSTLIDNPDILTSYARRNISSHEQERFMSLFA